MNSLDQKLKFSMVWSREWLQFLDTKVFPVGNRLSTCLHKNETDRNTLLKFDSCHPRRMIKALPFSQILRARRIEEGDEQVKDTSVETERGFRKCGNPQQLIDEQKDRMLELKRTELLQQNKSKK